MSVTTWAGIEIPQDKADVIRYNQETYVNRNGERVPLALLYSVAFHENAQFRCDRQSEVPNSDPRYSWEGKEDSWGLFQLATFGVGHGYTREQLQDCDTNARIAVRNIVSSWDKFLEEGYDTWDALYNAIGPWSVRDAAWAMYQEFPYLGEDSTGAETPPNPNPNPPASTTPTPKTPSGSGGFEMPWTSFAKWWEEQKAALARWWEGAKISGKITGLKLLAILLGGIFILVGLLILGGKVYKAVKKSPGLELATAVL